uniref:Proteasome activator subunit 1 n=1 Tax=Lepisosteus oculatus TaxID=7918 RepID=W5LYH4_LEPOC
MLTNRVCRGLQQRTSSDNIHLRRGYNRTQSPDETLLKYRTAMNPLEMKPETKKQVDGFCAQLSKEEKVFELMTNTRTKIEGFQTQISKYFSERGDAVAKASKQPHVGDYRQLVHELDQNQYCEIRIMVLEVRNTYAVLYDIISKNFDKIKKPRGDGKALIY